ncbi:hypothetical protein MMC17_001946 [Xylographa soralifera]|nr:hypothetical protein [Xylographa soralifera]
MDITISSLEHLFLWTSSIFIALQAFQLTVLLGLLYVAFLLLAVTGLLKLRPAPTVMVFSTPLALFNAFFYFTILLSKLSQAQSSDVDTSVRPSGSLIGATSATTLPTAGAATVAASGTATTTFAPLFTVPAAADSGVTLLPNINDPNATDAQTMCPGYTGSDVLRTPYGLTATLTLAGPACNVYGTDIGTLNLTVEYQSSDRLSVSVVPAYVDASNTSQYILSPNLIKKPTADSNSGTTSLTNDLGFFWSNEPTFSFSVVRMSTEDVLFSTYGTTIVFEDQFVEFVSPLPENYNLYGLGEVIHGLRLGNNFTRTLYAADAGDPIDYNIYGSHPFYLDTRYYEVNSTTGNLTLVTSGDNEVDPSLEYVSYSHGVYNRNAHGQEILLRPSNVTWRQLGGSIDLYFFSGPTQAEVTSAYLSGAAGLPAMQQYFAFGFHQCRWGYANWSVVQEVVENYANFEIPLENIWTDIDYMHFYRDFENDPVRFNYSEGQQFLSMLHANNQHYIPIVDSAIYAPDPNNASDAYPPFDRGTAAEAFMLNPDGSLYIGEVWPGYTVFPDWIGGGAGQWWTDEMTTWHGEISWDGIWIDMSEASSFCIGSCGSNNLSLNPVHPGFALPGDPGSLIFSYPEGFNLTNATEAASASSAAASQSSANAASAGPPPTTTAVVSYLRSTPTPGVRNVEYPPYVINNVQGELAVHAIAPNATHHDGTQEYDVHNLFGHQILNATYSALMNIFPTKRPFIIGRSTFPGSGMFAGHWGGDNFSLWAYMFFSIPQALSFSLFGIPMFGVDTCGFQQNTDEELCNRWMQLSAFFPFYRNHNDLNSIPQEAYVWASVATATKTAMAIRFQLLPYMYTLFYQAHTTGSTVMRAMAWEFPNDPNLANADRQFFLGPAILVTPVLEQGASSVSGIFPGTGKGTLYYDWYTQTQVTVDIGQNVTIPAPLGHIPVYIRGGYVLPMQQPAMTTTDARATPWSVLVALSAEGTASGSLYLDDGESLLPNATLYVELAATASSQLWASGRGLFADTNPLANVTVLGAAAPGNVTLNGTPVGESDVSYNATSRVLVVGGLQSITTQGAWAQDWVLGW